MTPEGTRFLASYPITSPISGNSSETPSVSSTSYVMVGGRLLPRLLQLQRTLRWAPRPDANTRHAQNRLRGQILLLFTPFSPNLLGRSFSAPGSQRKCPRLLTAYALCGGAPHRAQNFPL